jgi:plasmid replication initiation protein
MKAEQQPINYNGHGRSKPWQGDLFSCALTNWTVKDDIWSMEIPIFSLSKKPDIEIRDYSNGKTYVKIIPSALGSATVFDKDLLIYIGSQIVEALNHGEQISPIVTIDSSDFLRQTERGDGRASFERIADMLRRLKGTTIEITAPKSDDTDSTDSYSLIADYHITTKVHRTEVVPYGKNGKTNERQIIRVLSFQVELSKRFYEGLKKLNVLTIDPKYFRLTSPIARRLYEIARKYCGAQPIWKINIDLLANKIGIKRERRKFRNDLRKIIKEDAIPEYRIGLDTSETPDMVVFYTRNSGELAQTLMKSQKTHEWFQTLERYNTEPAP